MNALSSFARPAPFVLLFFAGLLLPVSADAQQFSVSPTSVSVQANAGTNPPSQTVRVKQRGKSTAWSVVQANASWLSVSPTSGVNDGTLTLTFTTSALAAGQYQTSFRVQSSTGSAITVNVQASLVAAAAPSPPSPPAALDRRHARRNLSGEHVRSPLERLGRGRDVSVRRLREGSRP